MSAAEDDKPVGGHKKDAGLDSGNHASMGDHHDQDTEQGYDKPSIANQIRDTVDESKAWLESELNFQKVRLRDGGQRVKSISIFIGAAIILLLCAFISLLLGIFLTITFYFGPIIALITVPFTYCIIAYALFRMAMGRIRNLKTVIEKNGGITGLKTENSAHDVADDKHDAETSP